MIAKKYILPICIIIDLGLSIAFAQEQKKEATLDDLKQDSVSETLVVQQLNSGEDFNNVEQFELAPGTESFAIPDERIPKIRTQDGTPLCQTFCPTVLAEFQYCKQNGIPNCKNLPNSERISPISTLTYRDNVDNKLKSSIGSLSTSGGRATYEVMNSISASSEQTFFSEDCAPFDQVAKAFNNNAKEIEKFRSGLEEKFKSIKAKLKDTEATTSSCPECIELLSSINKGFHSKSDFKGLATALKVSDFNGFLFRVLFEQQAGTNKNCKEITLKKRVRANYFPRSWEPYSSVPMVFEHAYDQIKKNNPVVLSSICFAKSKANDSCNSHCMILTGKKTVRNKTTGELVELVKVHNSWGQEWQDQHSGGWVRADKLKSLVRTVDDQKVEKKPEERKDAYRFTISWFE